MAHRHWENAAFSIGVIMIVCLFVVPSGRRSPSQKRKFEEVRTLSGDTTKASVRQKEILLNPAGA